MAATEGTTSPGCERHMNHAKYKREAKVDGWKKNYRNALEVSAISCLRRPGRDSREKSGALLTPPIKISWQIDTTIVMGSNRGLGDVPQDKTNRNMHEKQTW